MTTRALNTIQPAQTRIRYASILRCIGQFFETMDLKAVEVKTHGDVYIVQAWNKGTSMTMDLEKHWTLDDLRKLNAEAREKRKPFAGPPNLLSLSQILRLAGNYVDRMGSRLLKVSWQDQSDKIQPLPCNGSRSNRDENRASRKRRLWKSCASTSTSSARKSTLPRRNKRTGHLSAWAA